MRDVLAGVRAYLRSRPSLADFVSGVDGVTRVFAGSLPDDEIRRWTDPSKVRASVLLQLAPAAKIGGFVPIIREGIDALCYGPTARISHQVRRLVHDELKYLAIDENGIPRGTTVATDEGPITIRSAHEAGGASQMLDPDGQWHLCLESWIVEADEF